MIIDSSVVLIGFVLLFCCYADDQWMYQSDKKWDKEWRSGQWTYLESVAVERSRIAVIGGVLVPMYAPSRNSSIIDVGCGEGATADFLPITQKSLYTCVEISKEAIHAAKASRGPPLKFVHSPAHLFAPKFKHDIIIFNEMLYYVEHEKVLQQYNEYLTPKGIVIISIFHPTEKLLYENIFEFARKVFLRIDEMEISGYTKKSEKSKQERTAFHIEVYRKR